MMRATAIGLVILCGSAAVAEAAVVAARTLPAGTVIVPEDIAPGTAAVEGDTRLASGDPGEVLGRQARTTIYEGRPVQAANLENPTLVERNALVVVTYAAGDLSISTEGRALGKGGAGDTIRVLNIASRVTLSARINPDGTLAVVTRP